MASSLVSERTIFEKTWRRGDAKTHMNTTGPVVGSLSLTFSHTLSLCLSLSETGSVLDGFLSGLSTHYL